MTTHVCRSFTLLPPWIVAFGYRFRLQFHKQHVLGFGIGYVVTDCLSHKHYKIQILKNHGVWEEKAEHRRMTSTGTDFLFFVPLLTLDDEELQCALKTLYASLFNARLINSIEPDDFANPITLSEL